MNIDNKSTQFELILNHMYEFGSITMLEAIQDYGIGRLQARICDLRKMGFPIITTYETSKNRFGKPIRFARYSIDGNNKNLQNS